MKIAGRYEILAKVGQGGMGIVYRAYDPAPMDREVAVKTLHEFADPLALDLFYRECRALKSISHPNIVEIFDMGEFEENGQKRPYFVMPLLPGRTLDELIRKEGHRLTVERVVEIMSQTCRGLQAAHDRGLIHRDLKPSNIFVMADDSVKLIDFGVAHAVTAHSRTTGFDKGTLLYMAPEQLQHKPVSAQSDIYALGLTMYEALTRRQPFRAANESEIINLILHHTPPPACDVNPAVSPLLSRTVHKAIAKQPWSRYETAREFAETMQKALRNEPIAMFDPARVAPRIQTAIKALEKGDEQFAGEIVSELEAEGSSDPQIATLRAQIDQVVRRKTIERLLDSARARYEEGEDALALQKIREVFAHDPGNTVALDLQARIEARRTVRQRTAPQAQPDVTLLKPPSSRTIQGDASATTVLATPPLQDVPREKIGQPISPARLIAIGGTIAALGLVAAVAFFWSSRPPAGTAVQPTQPPLTAVAPSEAPVAAAPEPVAPAPAVTSQPAPPREPPPAARTQRSSAQTPARPIETPQVTSPPAAPPSTAPPATTAAPPQSVPPVAAAPTQTLTAAPAPVSSPSLVGLRGPELLNLGYESERSRDWQAALRAYERVRAVDPAFSGLALAGIARVREQMHADGADAFKRAREYDAMNRVDDAVAWYERAFRNLPDDSPDKKTAADRLRALKPVR